MFDKLKQGKDLLKMRSEVMQMQKTLRQITHMEVNRGMEVIVAADKSVVSIKIDGEDKKDLVELINKAFKESDKKAQKKLLETEGLSGILSKFS